jgi:hypothetical protein
MGVVEYFATMGLHSYYRYKILPPKKERYWYVVVLLAVEVLQLLMLKS